MRISRPLRLLAIVVVGTVVVVAAAVVALHTGPARARVLEAVLTRVAPDGSIRVGELDYWLPGLRFELRDVQMLSPEDERPWFRADRVAVRLAWSALRGELAFREVVLDAPRMTVWIDADGTTNFSGGTTRIEEAVRLDRLALHGLEILWQDDAAGGGFEARAIDLEIFQGDLARSALTVGEPLRALWDGGSLEAEHLEGKLGWTGRDLILDRLGVDSELGPVGIDGSIGDLLADRQLALQTQGDISLDAVARLARSDVPASGAIRWSSEIQGAIAPDAGPSLRLDATATSPRLTWGEAGVDGLDARLDGDPLRPELDLAATARRLHWGSIRIEEPTLRGRLDSGFEIVEATARVVGGEVAATGSIALTEAEVSRLVVTWQELSVADLMEIGGATARPPVGASASGSAELGWTSTTPAIESLDASFRATLSPTRAPLPLGGTVEVVLAGGRWRAAADVRSSNIGRLAVRDATGSLATDTTLTGSYDLTIDDLSAARDLASDLQGDPTLPSVDGRARVRGNLLGTILAPGSNGDLTFQDLTVAGASSLAGSARFELSATAIDLQEIEIETPAGGISGALRVDLDSLAVEGTVRTDPTGLGLGRLLSLAPADALPASLPALEGSVKADLRFSGTLPVPGFDGQVTIDGLTIAGRGPGSMAASFTRTPLGTRIDSATLSIGPERLSVAGLLAHDGSSLDLMAVADVADPAGLLERPELAAIGSLHADAGVGWSRESGQLTVDLWRLGASVGPERLSLQRPARFGWDGGTLVVEDLALRAGDFRVSAAGALGSEEDSQASSEPLRIELLGEVEGVEGLAELAWGARAGAATDLGLAGALSAMVEIRGTLARPRPSGRLELREGSAGAAGMPGLEEITALLSVDANRVEMERFGASLAGIVISASGRLPLGLLPIPGVSSGDGDEARLHLEFGGLTPASLQAWRPELDTSAMELDLAGSLDLAASALEIEAIRGELVATRLRVGSSGVSFVQSEPTRLSLEGGRLRVETWDWARDPDQRRLDASRLRLTGQIGLTGDQQLDLTAGGDLRLAALAPFLPPGSALDGRATLELTVGGTVAAPAPIGRIRLDSLTARMDSPRLAVTDVNGTLTLRDGALSADSGLRGRLNGGDALLTVEIDLSEPTSPTGLLGLVGRSIPFEAAGMQVNSDVDITAAIAGLDDTRVFGSITLLEGGYRTRQSLAGALRRASAATATAAAPDASSWLESISLDLRVRSGDELVIDAPFAQASATADLQITGTASRPGAVGDLEIREGGRVFLNGVTYSVSRGRLAFTDPSRIAPTIDLEAGTRISRYEIDLSISGDAFSPTVDATSNPSLGEADVLSLMATGRTLEAASAETGQVVREQAFAMLTGQLRGVTSALGLDSVRLEQGQGLAANPFERPDETDLFPRTTELATRLTLARSITDWFQLAFSQNLGETGGQSWVGTVELPWDVQVRAGVFDDDSRSLDLRHGLTFGRAPEEPGRRVSARVDSVEIEGRTGLAVERLRERLALDPGDNFDFIDWQRDQDRLLRVLVEEGYREAAIRARREAVGDLGPDGRARAYRLVYEIEAGPTTRLTVTGFDPEPDTIEELERLWVDSIATEFLLDDLREETRRSLIERGWLAPQIEVTLVSSSPVKEILVAVEPGPRTGRARLRLVGNRGIAEATIRERLRLDDALYAAWFDPDRVVRAVVGLYRERGWLDVQVRVEPPVEDDGEAGTRRVVIEENRRYLIEAIEIEGVDALDIQEVRAAAGSALDRPLQAATVDAAIADVVGLYFEAAHNEVRVTSSTRVRPGTTSAVLVLSVQEGPVHVLDGIRVVGRHRTRRGIVDRAIGVDPGEPIGAREVERIRRRLYRVEAFRSVSTRITPVGPANGGRQPVRLDVELIELPAFQLRYGLQVLDLPGREGRETEPGLSALVTHRNFLGVGATASVLARGRRDELFGRSSLSFPRLLGLPIRTTLLAQQARRDESRPFDLPPVSRTETVLQLSQSTESLDRVVLGYSFNFERSTAEDPISPFPPVPTVVTRLSPLALYDTRNDLFAPSRGIFHSSTLEMSLSALGSDLPFLKYTARQALFVPWGGVVFATSLRFGTGRSLQDGVDTLDSSEFYLAGGENTVRGYPEDSLGRTPFFGSFLPGGDAVLIANQEIRFPIKGWLQGVAFADAGSAFTSVDEIALSKLAASLGGGLRLVTPYVILRLDYGIRLSDIPGIPDASRGRLHFGIGHAF